MEKERIHVIFVMHDRKESVDLDIPLDISAQELITGLKHAYALSIDLSDLRHCFLKAENPFSLLRGNKTLAEYGIKNGTKIHYTG